MEGLAHRKVNSPGRASEAVMSILNSIPKGRGYRRSLAFVLDLVVCFGIITVLLQVLGMPMQPVQFISGFVFGAAFGWILRNAFSDR